VNNYPTASETYKSLIKKNVKLKEFVDKVIKEKNFSDLNFYLITPVQSINFHLNSGLPRYRMLLADLLKNTDEDHNEYEDLKLSLNQMEEIALSINQSKKELDIQNQQKDLVQSFKGIFFKKK
jgi:hypothetical protein